MSLSCPMLTPTNYTVWAIKVEAILDAAGVWEAVSPADGEKVDEKKNKTARAQLLGTLSEDILMQVCCPVSRGTGGKEVMAMARRPLPREVHRPCPSRRRGASSTATGRRFTGELRHRW